MAKYKATRNFHHDQLGSIKKNHQFEATEAQISPVKQFVTEVESDDKAQNKTEDKATDESYNTKVTHEQPAGGDDAKKSGKTRNK